MKLLRVASFALLSLALVAKCVGQGFVNLDFEDSYIVGFNTGTAYVVGWKAYGAYQAVNDSGGTTLWYNNETFDAANASLEGVNYFRPAIDGQYSIYLQGGTVAGGIYGISGAAIGQTAQIPATAKSITYWSSGGHLVVTFDGQLLSFNSLGTGANHSVYGADISAYAGQTGELRFTAPWLRGGDMIDNIEFSSVAIPEPSVLSLFGICIACLFWRMGRKSNELAKPYSQQASSTLLH